MGVALLTWGGTAVILAAFGLAVEYRIAVEERALRQAMGEEYEACAKRTKRLIPFIW